MNCCFIFPLTNSQGKPAYEKFNVPRKPHKEVYSAEGSEIFKIERKHTTIVSISCAASVTLESVCGFLQLMNAKCGKLEFGMKMEAFECVRGKEMKLINSLIIPQVSVGNVVCVI